MAWWRGANGLLLFLLRQFPMQRRNDDVRPQPGLAELSFDAPDLSHAWKEDQQTA